MVLFGTGKNLNSLLHRGFGPDKKTIVKRKSHGLTSLRSLSSRDEQLQLSKKQNMTEEIEREERDLIFTRETTTLTTIVEYYEDETGTTWNPLRQFPLPDKFNYDWLANYTDATETENTMFYDTMDYGKVETLPYTYDYHQVFGHPDNKSDEIPIPSFKSNELSAWNPSNETLQELRNVSRLMELVTFDTDYYEFNGVKYTPPLFDLSEVDIDKYTTPEWYGKFQREVVENFTLPTIKTSKKWRWMVSRDRERARLSSLGLLTPWPTTTRFTGDPFEDLNDSYFENKLAIPSDELRNFPN